MEQDTAPEMAARYRERIGRLTPAERLAQAVRLTEGVRALAVAGLRQRHPGASETELRWRLAELLYGPEVAERVRRFDHRRRETAPALRPDGR